MKNILLLVHDDAGQEARFQAALDVARVMEGHLTCLDVAIMPAVVATEFGGDGGLSMLLADERTREASNRAKLEARLSHEDVPWDWIDTTGTLALSLRDASNLADLIVVNRQLDDFPMPDMRMVAGELIVRSKKPVLAVPEGLKRFEFGSALVAWDGSAASAAALRAATPLLSHAESVTIVEIDDGSVKAPAEEAAAYLSRHGVHASVRRLPYSGRTAADTLLTQASNGEFTFAVMGGFGHLRFTEALFGGVTRTMLTRSPIPVLLAH